MAWSLKEFCMIFKFIYLNTVKPPYFAHARTTLPIRPTMKNNYFSTTWQHVESLWRWITFERERSDRSVWREQARSEVLRAEKAGSKHAVFHRF